MHERVIPEQILTQNPDMFASEDREQEYLSTHNIELRRLSNGITIVGMPRQVEDRAHATLNITLPSGAYNDPPGKSGLYHLVEHLVAKDALFDSQRTGVPFNAMVHATGFRFEIKDALANPEFRELGIWPMLKTVREIFSNPFGRIGNIDEAIEIEKGVVSGENAQKVPHTFLVQKINEHVFDPTHPRNISIGGTPEDLASITNSDVYQITAPLFHPEDVMMTVLTEGKRENCKVVVDELATLFEDFRGGDKKAAPFDPIIQDKLHPDFRSGNVYRRNIGFRNGRATVNFIWKLPYDKYSSAHLNYTHLESILRPRFIEFSRHRGLGYASQINTLGLHATQLLFMQLDVPIELIQGTNLTNKLFGGMREYVIRGMQDEEVEKYLKRKKRELEAQPLPIETRLAATAEGIREYGKIIDLDIFAERMKTSTIADIKGWQQRLSDELPAIFAFF